MMSLKRFEDQFTINPSIDIKPFFDLQKTIEAEIDNVNVCLTCKKTSNHILKSSPWTTVGLCNICQTLTVIYHQYHMDGICTELIELYKEKK